MGLHSGLGPLNSGKRKGWGLQIAGAATQSEARSDGLVLEKMVGEASLGHTTPSSVPFQYFHVTRQHAGSPVNPGEDES